MHFAKPVPSNATRRVVKQGMEMEKLGNELLFPPFANFSSSPPPPPSTEKEGARQTTTSTEEKFVTRPFLPPPSSLFNAAELSRESRSIMDGKCSRGLLRTKENGDYSTCLCRRMLDCVVDRVMYVYTCVQIIDGIL